MSSLLTFRRVIVCWQLVQKNFPKPQCTHQPKLSLKANLQMSLVEHKQMKGYPN